MTLTYMGTALWIIIAESTVVDAALRIPMSSPLYLHRPLVGGGRMWKRTFSSMNFDYVSDVFYFRIAQLDIINWCIDQLRYIIDYYI